MNYTYKHTLRACYLGYVTQAIVINILPIFFIIIQDKYGISFEKLGRLVLINFVTQIAVDVLAVRYADRIGFRVIALAAHIISAFGLICLGILPNILPSPYMGLEISVVIYAIGGGLIEIVISPIVDSLPGNAKASAMSLLHSFYCWGQFSVIIVTTLLLKLIGSDAWFILPFLWSLIPVYNAFEFMKVPLVPSIAIEEKIPVKQLLNARIFWVSLVLMLCAGASEQAMSQWASLFAEKGLGITKVVGDILGPSLFAVFMGIGRTIYGLKGHKISLKKALTASSALCILCYAITVLIRIPLISLLGCAATGFAVSLMWPGLISLTSGLYPKGGTSLFAVLAISGDVGCSLGPWIVGLVSDLAQKSDITLSITAFKGLAPGQLGLKTGIFAAIIFPVLMFLVIINLKKDRQVQIENKSK